MSGTGKDNKYRYVVATQNASLREELRLIPGVPIIYINSSSVLILELPSKATLDNRVQVRNANTI